MDNVPGSAELPATIPVIEEQLDVTRRVVETGGGVRIRKVVHEAPVTVTEMLRGESVEVTRKPIGREVDGPVAVRHDGDVTIYPVVLERLVTTKQLVLVEEIHVRRVPRVEHVSQQVSLRTEEAIVERQTAGTDDWSAEANHQSSDRAL